MWRDVCRTFFLKSWFKFWVIVIGVIQYDTILFVALRTLSQKTSNPHILRKKVATLLTMIFCKHIFKFWSVPILVCESDILKKKNLCLMFSVAGCVGVSYIFCVVVHKQCIKSTTFCSNDNMIHKSHTVMQNKRLTWRSIWQGWSSSFDSKGS